MLRHLVVRLHQILRILRLIVKFSSKLMVLQDSEPGLSLQLLIVECHQICLSLLNFEIHLFGQFFHIFDLFKLSLVDANHSFAFLSLVLDFESSDFSLHFLLCVAKGFLLLHCIFTVLDVLLKRIELLFVLFTQVGHLVVLIFFSLVVGRHLFVRHVLEKLNRHLLLGVGICVPRLGLIHVFVMLADTLLGFFELSPCTFILFLVNAHLFKQLLKDLTLCYIKRLVLVRVGT